MLVGNPAFAGIPITGYRLLITGYWLLVTGYWLLVGVEHPEIGTIQ